MTQGPEFLIVAFVKLEQGLNKSSIIIVGVLIVGAGLWGISWQNYDRFEEDVIITYSDLCTT